MIEQVSEMPKAKHEMYDDLLKSYTNNWLKIM